MVGVELWIVRLASTLLFFGFVVMAVVTIQSGEKAWGYGLGALAFGIAAGFLWKDDLVAQANLREQQKADGIRTSQQEQLIFPDSSTQPARPVPPPTGPGSPIQRSN
jgi:hypothetical protein